MKGGVGKTTAAVNLSYLAAADGQRTLCGTSIYRRRPVSPTAYGPASQASARRAGRTARLSPKPSGRPTTTTWTCCRRTSPTASSIDCSHRLGNPARVVTGLLDTLGRDYDTVFLDCPAGFSLLTEGIFAAADMVLVPSIPTVLSLRTVAQLIERVGRANSPSELAVFFSMVDGRKALHRRACEWAACHPEIFLTGQIPYASVVEQMAFRRMPLAAFAPRDCATSAFAGIWAELQTRLHERQARSPRPRERWVRLLRAVESQLVRLETSNEPRPSCQAPPSGVPDSRQGRQCRDTARSQSPAAGGDMRAGATLHRDKPGGDVQFVHGFDTDRRDLQRCGYVLELREHEGSFMVVAAVVGADGADTTRWAQAQIDNAWAMQILSGDMSALVPLKSRLGLSLIVAGRERGRRGGWAEASAHRVAVPGSGFL